MVWPNARAAAATSLLASVGVSGFANAFVSPPSSYHGPTALTALHKASLPSATTGTSRPQHHRSNNHPSLYAEGPRCVPKALRPLGGVRDGEEGEGASAGAEERTLTTESRPATATASTVSGLAAGAAVVALSALGGFPELAAAEAPAWVLPTKLVLDPLLLYFEVAFVARIILSWYPKLDLNSAPQNLVAWPTEPILRPTRAVIPPAFGVDISPIVWVMICSLLHEILLGQQGILNLMSNK